MTGDAVHRLGVLVCVVAAATFLAFTIAVGRRRRAVRRRIQALLRVERERQRRRPEYGAWVRRWAAPLGAVMTGCVLVGGVTGCVVGLGGAYGVSRWQRSRKPAAAGAEEQQASRQLPLAADLLAACISAGAGPREAAEAVGESLGGPVGERLARAAAELRLGGELGRGRGGGSGGYRERRRWAAAWSEPTRPGLRPRNRCPGLPSASGRTGRGRSPNEAARRRS